MNRLVKIAQLAAPRADVQYRRAAYGGRDIRRFLRDVIAMANTSIEGPRFIVIGLDFDDGGRKRLHSVPTGDFSGKPSYASLVMDFIEPQIRIQYEAVTVEGKQLGIFEMPHCPDKPYMMRIDHSETLRRGDGFVRVNDSAMKLGRGQLHGMFEKKFQESESAKRIEVGFPGEIIHKVLKIRTTDLATMPSAIASSKLNQLLQVRSSSVRSGATTAIARLTHARLFGSDDPYETKSRWELIEEMAQIKLKHQGDDERFLFEQNAEKLQLVVYNQGDEPIQDASLVLALPNHPAFLVADHLPTSANNCPFLNQHPAESEKYPAVRAKKTAIHVSKTLGEIPCGEPVLAFEIPLRVCAGSELQGRKFGMSYALSAANLRYPAKGTLRLLFQPGASA